MFVPVVEQILLRAAMQPYAGLLFALPKGAMSASWGEISLEEKKGSAQNKQFLPMRKVVD